MSHKSDMQRCEGVVGGGGQLVAVLHVAKGQGANRNCFRMLVKTIAFVVSWFTYKSTVVEVHAV